MIYSPFLFYSFFVPEEECKQQCDKFQWELNWSRVRVFMLNCGSNWNLVKILCKHFAKLRSYLRIIFRCRKINMGKLFIMYKSIQIEVKKIKNKKVNRKWTNIYLECCIILNCVENWVLIEINLRISLFLRVLLLLLLPSFSLGMKRKKQPFNLINERLDILLSVLQFIHERFRAKRRVCFECLVVIECSMWLCPVHLKNVVTQSAFSNVKR